LGTDAAERVVLIQSFYREKHEVAVYDKTHLDNGVHGDDQVQFYLHQPFQHQNDVLGGEFVDEPQFTFL
jgi:hypothetical protein